MASSATSQRLGRRDAMTSPPRLDDVPTKLWSQDRGLAERCAEEFRARVVQREPVRLTRPGRQLLPLTPDGDLWRRPRCGNAEGLLVAQEALETGDLSYAEYQGAGTRTGVVRAVLRRVPDRAAPGRDPRARMGRH
jgi:hypothetical protein